LLIIHYSFADPYGFNKTMGKDDFFEAVSFRNDCLPEFVKKAMPSNTMISFISAGQYVRIV